MRLISHRANGNTALLLLAIHKVFAEIDKCHKTKPDYGNPCSDRALQLAGNWPVSGRAIALILVGKVS
jgi:hypothetical protein